jgi:hypothetical protein
MVVIIGIRSLQDGLVHQLSVHTVGGVITASETLMLIVPEGDELTVEAKVQTHDIDQLRVGQKCVLRFSAFNQRTTPEINGVLKQSPPISRRIKGPAVLIISRGSPYRWKKSTNWVGRGLFRACRLMRSSRRMPARSFLFSSSHCGTRLRKHFGRGDLHPNSRSCSVMPSCPCPTRRDQFRA